MVLGKKVTIFDWEWGRNSAPRDGQKRPCAGSIFLFIQEKIKNVCETQQNNPSQHMQFANVNFETISTESKRSRSSMFCIFEKFFQQALHTGLDKHKKSR